MSRKKKEKVAKVLDLPDTIYVKQEVDGDDPPYLLADDSLDNLGEDGDTIGVYELVATNTLRVGRLLE